MEEGRVQRGLCGDRTGQTGQTLRDGHPKHKGALLRHRSLQPTRHSQRLVLTAMAQEDKPEATVAHQ